MAETAASGPGTPEEQHVEQLENRIEEQRVEFAETAGALADKADVKKQGKLRLGRRSSGRGRPRRRTQCRSRARSAARSCWRGS
jgi:hypothetical protein